jgi:hypothetical protein
LKGNKGYEGTVPGDGKLIIYLLSGGGSMTHDITEMEQAPR